MSQLYKDDSFLGVILMLKYHEKMQTDMYTHQTTPNIEYSEIENNDISNNDFNCASLYHLCTKALQVTLSQNYVSRNHCLVPIDGFKARYKRDTWFVMDMINPNLFTSLTLCRLRAQKRILWRDVVIEDLLQKINFLIRDDSSKPMTRQNIETGEWMYSLGRNGWINIYETTRGESYIGIKSGFDVASYENFEEMCFELQEKPLDEVLLTFAKWREALFKNQLRILARIIKTCFDEEQKKDVIPDPVFEKLRQKKEEKRKEETTVANPQQEEHLEKVVSTYPSLGVPPGFMTPSNFEIKGTQLPRGVNLEGQETEPDTGDILKDGTYERFILDDFTFHEKDEVIRLAGCTLNSKDRPYCVVRGPMDDVCFYVNKEEQTKATTRVQPTQMNKLEEKLDEKECDLLLRRSPGTWERSNVNCPLILRDKYKEYKTENEEVAEYRTICSRMSCYNGECDVYEDENNQHSETSFGYHV